METLNTYYNGYGSLSGFVESHYSTLNGADKPVVLAQIFSGRCEKDFLEKLSAEITRLIPHACVIGTTTSGEIMDGEVSGLRTVLSFTVFRHSRVKAALFPKTDQDDMEIGQAIATELGGDEAKLLILYGTGNSMNSEAMLQGIQSVHPSLPVSGGIAGGNSATEPSFVVCGGQVIDRGVAAVALEGRNLTVNCFSHLGWQPIGKEMMITKADTFRVYTIDNMPAYEVYRKYLGLDETGNFLNVIEYPLVVSRNGILAARTAKAYYEDGSLGFAAELREGERVRFSFGHIGMISEAMAKLCKEIRQLPAESIYVYSCECRRGFLQELSTIETEPLQEIAPTAGFFTLGEFFHRDGTNQLLNATMTVAVLSESDGKSVTESVSETIQQALSEDPLRRKDSVAERNTGVLKALTHLVNTVTAELAEINERLRYSSLYDSLTGLHNRAFFEQEMKRLDSLDDKVGVIVCDLDYLKPLNDAFGHDTGDQVLKLAADVIAKSCTKDHIVARIGGDEFAILVPNPRVALLESICNRILSEAAKQRSLTPKGLLYLSVGYAIKGAGRTTSMRDAFKAADANMYRQKSVNKRKQRPMAIRSLASKARKD